MNAGLPRVALVRLQKVLVWAMRKRIVNSTRKKRSKNKCSSGLKGSYPRPIQKQLVEKVNKPELMFFEH